MKPDDLLGRRYGPVTHEVTRHRVGAFVTATADDQERWETHAPPGYAGAVLFAVAPEFLADPDVAPLTRSLVHTEQRFTWLRPLEAGERLEVRGEVSSVRERGALVIVGFDVDAGADQPWLVSSSTFLLSAEAAAAAAEEAEPHHAERGPVGFPGRMSVAEGALPTLARSASRADLVRYAGASGDWNPIHWDHDAARAAGLPGVIVHGLLMASWLCQSAARLSWTAAPIDSMRIRFRSALRPAVAATVSGRVTGTDEGGSDLDLELVAGDQRLVTASARVTT